MILSSVGRTSSGQTAPRTRGDDPDASTVYLVG